MVSRKRYIEIVKKYNMPIPVDEIKNKEVDYVVDNYDMRIIVFKDNTCYFLWTETESSHIFVERNLDYVAELYDHKYMDALKLYYPEAYEEYNMEVVIYWQNNKVDYDRYLKLKQKFEGK